ncbi:MAG: thiamine biosynthesis protein ThiF, partial [Clostridiales bacterium]
MAIPSKEEFRKALEQRHGAALQDRFSRASVAVCGLGGLGSGIAIALARAGVGRLHLLDFDKVELSNLNRQQYTVSQLGMYKTEALRDTLLSVAPYCETVIHTERIGEENLEELLRDAEVVCEAL